MKRKFNLILITALAALMVCFANQGSAQALYNNGAAINIAAGTTVYVTGDFTNAAGSTVNNAGTLKITGNTTNNATMSLPTGGTLLLEGSTAQTLGGTSDYFASDIVINNAAGVTLGAKLRIDGILSFTNGLINAPAALYPVVFTSNASVSVTSLPADASHINGNVVKEGTGAFTCPIGDAVKYQPVGINLGANSAGITASYNTADAGTAPFTAAGTDPQPLTAYNKLEYWNVAPIGTATGSVTIFFDSYMNYGIAAVSDLRVAHKTGGAWLNEGAATAAGTIAAGSVTSNSISTWSPFTLGSINTLSTLPLSLLYFTGTPAGNANVLNWHTALEEPGIKFIIERSAGGNYFLPFATITGKGNGGDYIITDATPFLPVTYYRLRIQAVTGIETYSSIVAVHKKTNVHVTLTPNPATSLISINNTDLTLNGKPATVTDMQGKQVYKFIVKNIQQINVNTWASGMYTLTMSDGTTLKLIKN